MKKIILIVLMFSLLLTGCGRVSQKSVVNDFKKKFDKSSGYQLHGELLVNNNDDTYTYDISVCFKKDDYYKVTLTNTANDHTQVILKNEDGVYVLTPSLNKSFRFQSDWPYNNSQIYLINALVNDMVNDKKLEFQVKDNQYIFKTNVEYPNNSKLVKQKIILNKNLNLKKVIVYDSDGVDAMTMTFDKIKYSPKFSKDEFKIESIIDVGKDDSLIDETTKETGSLEDVIYPLFVPSGTKLVDEERIKKENGERVIMNYDGEKSFLLVEETADVFREFTIIPSSGEPYPLMDTMGVMTNNSLSWTSGGVEFYLVSDVMSKDEMVEVAQSITGIVSMK